MQIGPKISNAKQIIPRTRAAQITITTRAGNTFRTRGSAYYYAITIVIKPIIIAANTAHSRHYEGYERYYERDRPRHATAASQYTGQYGEQHYAGTNNYASGASYNGPSYANSAANYRPRRSRSRDRTARPSSERSHSRERHRGEYMPKYGNANRSPRRSRSRSRDRHRVHEPVPVRPRESVPSHVPEPVPKSQSVTPTPPPRPLSQSAASSHVAAYPARDDWAAKIHPRAVLVCEDELFTPLQGESKNSFLRVLTRARWQLARALVPRARRHDWRAQLSDERRHGGLVAGRLFLARVGLRTDT